MTRMFSVNSWHNEKYEFVKGSRVINLHDHMILNTNLDKMISYE